MTAEWQPIETPPPKMVNGWGYVLVHWSPEASNKDWFGSQVDVANTVFVRAPENAQYITHWTPLPPAPQPEGTEEKP